MKSKLFNPVVRSTTPTAIEEVESARIFMNPPTHPEIPLYDGPTDTGGTWNPLSMGETKKTLQPQKRVVGGVKKIFY